MHNLCCGKSLFASLFIVCLTTLVMDKQGWAFDWVRSDQELKRYRQSRVSDFLGISLGKECTNGGKALLAACPSHS